MLRSPFLSILAAYIRPAGTGSNCDFLDRLTEGLCNLDLEITLVIVGDLNTRWDIPQSSRTLALMEALEEFRCWVVNPAGSPTFEAVACTEGGTGGDRPERHFLGGGVTR